MHVAFFSGHQDDAFIPAMLWCLLGTAVVVALVIFWPRVVKQRRGPRASLLAISGVIALAALVLTIAQVAHGFAVLGPQRADLQAQISSRYGVTVADADATALLNGDSLKVPATPNASNVQLNFTHPASSTGATKTVRLEFHTKSGGYILTTGGVAGEIGRGGVVPLPKA